MVAGMFDSPITGGDVFWFLVFVFIVNIYRSYRADKAEERRKRS